CAPRPLPPPPLFPYTTLFRSSPGISAPAAQTMARQKPYGSRAILGALRQPANAGPDLTLTREARIRPAPQSCRGTRSATSLARRSEEHTSELQSRGHLVCRLL